MGLQFELFCGFAPRPNMESCVSGEIGGIHKHRDIGHARSEDIYFTLEDCCIEETSVSR